MLSNQRPAPCCCSLSPQGITKAAGLVEDTLHMVRLWTHEVLRVFYDRWDTHPGCHAPMRDAPGFRALPTPYTSSGDMGF